MLEIRIAKLLHCCILFICINNVVATTQEYNSPNSQTIVTTKNLTDPTTYIKFQVLNKPHHIFVGRCLPEHIRFHGENIIVNNDGKSHVSGDIRINIQGHVYITCAKILDQIPNGDGGYPTFIDGGVGKNFIHFGVTTAYGKGFHFYVEIFGLKRLPAPKA